MYNTVEPLIEGHWTNHYVFCGEAILFWEVSKRIITMGISTFKTERLKGSFIRGSTVYIVLYCHWSFLVILKERPVLCCTIVSLICGHQLQLPS